MIRPSDNSKMVHSVFLIQSSAVTIKRIMYSGVTNTNNHTEKSRLSRRTTTSNSHARYSHSHVPITCQSHLTMIITRYNTKRVHSNFGTQRVPKRVVVTTKVQASHDTHSTSDNPEQRDVQCHSDDGSRTQWAQSGVIQQDRLTVSNTRE